MLSRKVQDLLESTAKTRPDPNNLTRFEREGCGPFTYATKRGERSLKSYWRMPDRLYDEPEELADWANIALEAARRSAVRAAKPRRARS